MDIALKDFKPAFAERNVPVAFSTDENYLPYLRVAINSIVANAKDANLDIIVLVNGMGADLQRGFLARFSGVRNLSIRFVDVGDAVKALDLYRFKPSPETHFTIAILYRLLLPYLLKDYGKIVYLDVDTCALGDISELYNTDIGDCFLGGVYDFGVEKSLAIRSNYRKWGAQNGFTEWQGYINSGVVIMNLAAFRASEGLFERLLDIILAGSKYFPDQDALNFTCKGRIKLLYPGWNVLAVPHCLKKQTLEFEGLPKILHYCSELKPWRYPWHAYAYFWWNNAIGEYGVDMWRKAFNATKCISNGEGTAATAVLRIGNNRLRLARTLVSYCAQTLENIEILCMVCGSTDGSKEVCEKFAAFDRRVRIIALAEQDEEAVRDCAIAEAKGKWIFFCDAEKHCRPEMMEKRIAGAEESAWRIVDARTLVECAEKSHEIAELDKKLTAANGRIRNCENEMKKQAKEIAELKSSFAYRTGMIVTWPLRKLKTAFDA